MGNKYQMTALVLAIGAELTAGVYVEPSAVLPMERGAGSPDPKFDTDVSDKASATHGSKETTVITDFATVEYSAKMKLPSNHSLIATAFQMCGVASVDITDGVAYSYDTNKETTCSLLWTEKRTKTSARGARADFTLTAEVKKAVEIEFSIKSQLNNVVDLATEAEDNVIPVTPDSSSVFMKNDCQAYLVNGNTAHFTKVSLKLKAEVVAPVDSCSLGAYTKDTAPEFTVSMALTEDNEAAFNDLRNGTEFSFVIPFFDVSGAKKYELVIPKAVVTGQKKSDSDGKLNVERTLECRQVSADDAFELKAFN